MRLKKCDIWPSDIQKISCVVVELRILASRYVSKMIWFLEFSELRKKRVKYKILVLLFLIFLFPVGSGYVLDGV